MVCKEAFDIENESFDEKLEIIKSWSESINEGLFLIRILVKVENSESIIDMLEKKWGATPEFRILIYEISATLPAPEEKEEKEEKEDNEDQPEPQDEKKDNNKRVAYEELVQQLTGQVALDRIYLLTVFLSTVVAAIGLMRGNSPIIIGAMVIAPFLSSNMLLALATNLGDIKLALSALRVIGSGLVFSLFVSTMIGYFIPFDYSIQEIISRTELHFSDIILALAAGSAGALAFTSGVSATLVGVMVAVALIPPLVVGGLFLGIGEWVFASKSLLLLCANIICINLSAIAMFVFQGIRPRYYWEAKNASKMVRFAVSLWLVLLLFLIGIIYILY
jgi:uncharacterized hydrophobic protein (TIGR00341 family)